MERVCSSDRNITSFEFTILCWHYFHFYSVGLEQSLLTAALAAWFARFRWCCLPWFDVCCMVGLQTVLDPMFIAVYNLLYTSLPVLALGVFEQDVNARNSLLYPKLYTLGLHQGLFNKREFFKSALHGSLASCVLFFIPYGELEAAKRL